MKLKNKLVAVFLSMLIAGCSANEHNRININDASFSDIKATSNTAELLNNKKAQHIRWTDKKNIAISTEVPQDKASVVIYRTADAIEGNTINTYVNGEYLASLDTNAYTQESVCPFNQRLYAQFTHNDPAYAQKAQLGNTFDLPVGKVSYFKVVNSGGQPGLQAVNEQIAIFEMKQMPKQTHTLSRVDKNIACVQPKQPKQVEKLEAITLEAGALFEFNKSSYNAILDEGKKQIQKVAQLIKNHPDTITNIKVIGHTDPQGKAAYNDKLSLTRAYAVKSTGRVRNKSTYY